jgi:hypothetical protein
MVQPVAGAETRPTVAYCSFAPNGPSRRGLSLYKILNVRKFSFIEVTPIIAISIQDTRQSFEESSVHICLDNRILENMPSIIILC